MRRQSSLGAVQAAGLSIAPLVSFFGGCPPLLAGVDLNVCPAGEEIWGLFCNTQQLYLGADAPEDAFLGIYSAPHDDHRQLQGYAWLFLSGTQHVEHLWRGSIVLLKSPLQPGILGNYPYL